ncbi:hypothetical protein Bca52824_076452 [Brassica carinata]|uniref:Uncharacterized protein n=1 Tax=Brassica carinata TaxID=52824 RepID=A0A8X7PU02_BRACI|nr:hypothetical protein Bca52824_076452 [Brassica carinata]
MFLKQSLVLHRGSSEGWSAQQGEASLDSRVDAEKDEESDSVDTDMPAPREETSRAGCSKSKKKRKEVDHEPYAVRNAILAEKNKIIVFKLISNNIQYQNT